jgi:cytochrome c553
MNRWTHFLTSVVFMSASALSICSAEEQGALSRPDSACAACHGPGGSHPATPGTPRLAGQEYDYLVQALGQYRSGARENPIMGAMAKSLSNTQTQTLARYFSSQPGLTTKY